MIRQTLPGVPYSPTVTHLDTASLRSQWADVPLMQRAADQIDGGERALVVDLVVGTVRLDVVQGPVLEQTSGLWSGIREVPDALRGTAEPILFHIRGRGWFYVLVHAGTALLCSPSQPYHGPYSTKEEAIESALSW